MNLDSPVMSLGGKPNPVLRLRDLTSGVQIFGGTGSGKTSGSGANLARSFLHGGLGGIVLCVKKDEREMWEKWITEAGRANHMIVIEPGCGLGYNFLQEELKRKGGRHTENLVNLICSVIEIANKEPLEGGKDPIWAKAAKQLLRNVIDLIKMADKPLTLLNIYRVIVSAPRNAEELDDPKWAATSFCWECLLAANDRNEAGEVDAQDFEFTVCYWYDEYTGLGDKTRGSIVLTITSALDPMLRGTLRELFSTPTGKEEGQLRCADPTFTTKGIIYVLDLSVKEYYDVGRIAQAFFKLLWQRAMERRTLAKDGGQAVFCWVDECQHFLTMNDVEFQQTARSVRAVSVYLTQNREFYQVALGKGEDGDVIAESILGNLALKIFHSNSSVKTNEWASALFQERWKQMATVSQGANQSLAGANADSQNQGTSFSKQLVKWVEPYEFTTLDNGGTENDCEVEAIIHQAGRLWPGDEEGCPFYRARFYQGISFKPPTR